MFINVIYKKMSGVSGVAADKVGLGKIITIISVAWNLNNLSYYFYDIQKINIYYVNII